MQANLRQIYVAHHWVKEEMLQRDFFSYHFHPVLSCLETFWGGDDDEASGIF